MTCYVTHNGAIKLDNYVVGHVYHDAGTDDSDALVWHWAARVNSRHLGSNIGSKGDFVRWYAFDCAKRECEQEAAVIR